MGQSWRLWVVLVEGSSPHSRPAIIVAVVVVIPYFVFVDDWRIGHPVPRRHTNPLGYLIDTVDGAAFIAAGDNQIIVNYAYLASFPPAFNYLHIKLLLLDQTVDDTALADGADEEKPPPSLPLWGGDSGNLRLPPKGG